MNELNVLVDIFKKCYEISKNTKADCFFDYSPHVNGIDISAYPQGFAHKDEAESVYVSRQGEWQERANTIYIDELNADLIFKALGELEKEAKSND